MKMYLYNKLNKDIKLEKKNIIEGKISLKEEKI